MDNSRCFGHNKGNYKCSKTTWWTQGKTQRYKAVFPPLSPSTPPPFQQETVIWYSSLVFPRSFFFVSFVLHLGRETHIRLLKTFRIQSVIERRDCVAIGQPQKGNADVYGTTAGPLILLFLILMNFWAGLLLLPQIKEWKRREREACCGMRQSFSFPSSWFPNSRGSCGYKNSILFGLF